MAETQLEKDMNFLILIHEKMDTLTDDVGGVESEADNIRQLTNKEGSEMQEFIENEVAPVVQSIVGDASLSEAQKRQKISETMEADEVTKEHLETLQRQLDKFESNLIELAEEVSTISELCSKSRDVITQLEKMESQQR